MDVRAYEESDRQSVIELWEECGLVAGQNNPHKDIDRKLQKDPDLFLVGTIGDNAGLVATVMGGYDGHRGWLNYLAVRPSQQRQGYGQQIVQAIELLLAKRGCPKINLQVRLANESAVAFYSALGYGDDRVLSLGKRIEHD